MSNFISNKGLQSTRVLTFCGVCIALATVLSMFKLMELPQGGSITLFSMFFIALPAYFFGMKVGLLSAVTYGVLQFILEPYMVTPMQVILDYPVAFGSLGFTGLCFYLNKFDHLAKYSLHIAFGLGCVLRFASSTASGVIFFSEYAPEGISPVAYSAAYNSFIFAELALTYVVISLPVVKKNLDKIKLMFI